MTSLTAALAYLDATQDAFNPVAQELNNARAALKRSNTKATRARFLAAEEAFEVALRVCDEAHDALMIAHDNDVSIKLAAEAENARHLSPLLI